MSEAQNSKPIKKILSKVRKLILSRDAFIFVVFLALAGIFWFVQSLDKQRETSLRIPVDYVGIPEDIEIENTLPKHIAIRVRDEGVALLRYSRRDMVPLALDMDRNYYGKGEFAITTDQLKDRLSRYVLPSTAIVSIEPDSILVKYYKLSNKTVPVKVKSNLSFSSQYVLSRDLLVEPGTVKVFGPKSVLDTLTAVFTETVEMKSLSDTTQVKAKLKKSVPSLKFAFEDVNVTAFVEMFTESKMQLPVTIINQPDHVDVRIFPPTVNVSFNVGLSNFNKVKETDIQLVFDCDEAKELKRRRYKLQIKNNSPYISNLRVSPEEVEFLFEEK